MVRAYPEPKTIDELTFQVVEAITSGELSTGDLQKKKGDT
jgi:hypothetical protein